VKSEINRNYISIITRLRFTDEVRHITDEKRHITDEKHHVTDEERHITKDWAFCPFFSTTTLKFQLRSLIP
jgi:hypothetical protein